MKIIAPYVDTIDFNRVSKTNRSLVAKLFRDVIGVAPVDSIKRGAIVSIYGDDDLGMKIGEFQFIPAIGLIRLSNPIKTTYYHPSFIATCIKELRS
jgi:hypothetical protein